MQRRHRPRKRELFLGVIVVALVLGSLYMGLQWLEAKEMKPETKGDYHLRYEDQQTTINGVAYRQKQNLITILFMGIDKDDSYETLPGIYGEAGQSDFMRLMVLDPVSRTITQIPIDRDTITPVTTYSILGERLKTREMQVCLAYSFGDGKKKSGEMALEAVRNLFYNVPIHYYVAMNLSGISVLNDLVGGVTVEITDDFSKVDPTMVQGTTMRLVGDQAEYFVRSRMSVGVGTNESRMARQQTYISKLFDMLSDKIRADEEFVGTIFDTLDQYLVTNMTRTQMINDAWRSRDYERVPLVEISGVHQKGNLGYMEFYPDEASLQQTVLDVFYQKAK